jgi:hypothetical protein
VCTGVIILLVIIYQGHAPSLVRARSQEELEAIFVGSLWRTGLTSVGQRSDQCLLQSRASDRSNRSASPALPVTPSTGSSSFRGRKVQVGRLAYSPLSRRHKGPFSWWVCSERKVLLAGGL